MSRNSGAKQTSPWSKRFQRVGLRTKVVVPFVILSAIPVVAVGLFSVSHMRRTLRQGAIDQVEFDTFNRAHELEDFLKSLHRDLRILGQARGLTALAQAEAAGRSDEIPALRREAERELVIFSQGRMGYQELRFVNDRAESVLRLDINDGKPRPVAPEAHPEGAIDQDYLRAALSLEPGEVYLAELMLKATSGPDSTPDRMVISCATPVAWDEGLGRGLLVVNVDPMHMARLIGPLPAGTEAWLIGDQGFYMGYFGESAEKQSRFSLGKRRPLEADFSQTDVQLIRSRNPDQRTFEREASLYSFASMEFDAGAAGQRWTLLVRQPTGPLLAPAREISNLLLFVMVSAILVAGFTGLLLANYVLRPISKLRTATRDIARGNLERRVTIATGDEIADLADDFNAMTGRVRDAQAQLAELNRGLQAEVTRQTDRLQGLQSGLARADKLASVGQMAASIMHEIGNPLAAIKTKIQVAEEGVELGGDYEDLLPELIREVDRLSDVLSSFSRLGRLRESHFESVSLDDVVQGVSALVAPDLRRRGIRLRVETTEDAPRAFGDADQLRQLLINFVLNAADASAEGEEVVVRVAPANFGTDGLPGTEIQIQDHGVGIEPDQLARIWEPMYTTKPDGTGLGLAICRQIVNDHGGNVEIRSTPGEGTIVTLGFPDAASDADTSAVEESLS